MKINSILLLLISVIAGLVTVVAIPKSRQWFWGRIMNNRLLRRTMIRLGMSVAPIRQRIMKKVYQGLT